MLLGFTLLNWGKLKKSFKLNNFFELIQKLSTLLEADTTLKYKVELEICPFLVEMH